ncbi:MAG: hypothetical protein IPN71_08470 [Fibrobacteres bacterium]|nr:hypothetical protein [Fibrobacterota bacterium]
MNATVSTARLGSVQYSWSASPADWVRIQTQEKLWTLPALRRGTQIPGGDHGFDVPGFARGLLTYTSGQLTLNLLPYCGTRQDLASVFTLPLTHLRNVFPEARTNAKEYPDPDPVKVIKFTYMVRLQNTCSARTTLLEWMRFLEANKINASCSHGRKCEITYKLCTKNVEWTSKQNSVLVIREHSQDTIKLSFLVWHDVLDKVPVHGPKTPWTISRFQKRHRDCARHLFGSFAANMQAFKITKPTTLQGTRSKDLIKAFYLWLGGSLPHPSQAVQRGLLRLGVDVRVPATQMSISAHKQHVPSPAQILGALDKAPDIQCPSVTLQDILYAKRKLHAKVDHKCTRSELASLIDLAM